MTEHSAATGAGDGEKSPEVMHRAIMRLLDEAAASRDQLRAKDAEIERLTKAAIMQQAAYDGMGSLLLDVQNDCIAAVNANAEKDAEIERLRAVLTELQPYIDFEECPLALNGRMVSLLAALKEQDHD